MTIAAYRIDELHCLAKLDLGVKLKVNVLRNKINKRTNPIILIFS